ncbi:N-acetylmuramoyl-L-alanine amidase [Planococcus koreensis]|uniref:N-acetylmuramoyl-L-alanine amidase n=1 Tax=Planococcus koreensis TaxID=112331 RepID=UPI0039FC0D29
MVQILNDRGHGVNTWPPSKGTNASGGVPAMAEHDFNAAVGDETERLLKGKLSVYSAQGSRQADVPLNTRIARYNQQFHSDKKAIGMSHHGNANGNKQTRGFGVFYWHTSAAGKRLAQMILAEYKREFPDMPIWGSGIFASKIGDWTNFAMLRDTAAPFVLIEWEFFTNDAARKIMLTSDYRKRCGKVASKVACDWHGVKFEEEKLAAVVKPATPEPVVKPEAPKPVPVSKPALSPAWKVEFDKQFAEAKELGITDGTRRKDPVSREEAAVMSVRAVQAAVDQVITVLKK